MRQVTVNAARWSQDSEGAWLCLRVKSPEAAMEVCDALKPGKAYTATIKGKGRSLDANGYAWVLLDKLAAHTALRERRYTGRRYRASAASARCCACGKRRRRRSAGAGNGTVSDG